MVHHHYMLAYMNILNVKSITHIKWRLNIVKHGALTKCRSNLHGQTKCRPVLGQGGQNAGFIKSYFNEKIMLNKQFNTNILTQKYIIKYWHIICRDVTEQSTLSKLGEFHENLTPILRVECSCIYNNL